MQIGAQLTHVRAARMLEHPQAEFRQNRQQMIEDVRLVALVRHPGHGIGKAVQLQRQAVGRRLQLAYDLGHVLVDARVLAQVMLDVGAEGTQVGDPAGVGWFLGGIGQFGVPAQQLALLVAQVLAEQQEALQAGNLVRAQKAHAGLVQVDRPLDAAAAGFLHAAIILERVADQAFGRNGGDGLVPVLHLDGMQGDVDDITVGIELWHLDPVTDAHDIAGRDLHAGHQRQQGVLPIQRRDSVDTPEGPDFPGHVLHL